MYEQIKFSLINLDNLTMIVDGTTRLGELTRHPKFTELYNRYAGENKMNAAFFRAKTSEADGVPVALAKLLASAIRDAFRAGANIYLQEQGKTHLAPALHEGSELLTFYHDCEGDIGAAFSVVCGAYQTARWSDGLPETCFAAALTAGYEHASKMSLDGRAPFEDPLTKYPFVLESRNVALKKYSGAAEFAAVYFMEQGNLMQADLINADSDEARTRLVEEWAEVVFATGLLLTTFVDGVGSLTVEQMAGLFNDPKTARTLGDGLQKSDQNELDNLIEAQADLLQQYFRAIAECLVSPLAGLQLLFVGGIDYGLALKGLKTQP